MSDTDTAGTVRFDRPRVEEKVVGTMTQSDMLNMQTREINLREELRVSQNDAVVARDAEALAESYRVAAYTALAVSQDALLVLQAKNAALEAQVTLGQVVAPAVPVDPPVVLQ